MSSRKIPVMGGLPDPDWYFENVLIDAHPGGPRVPAIGPAAQWRRWWTREVALSAAVRPARESGFVRWTSELDVAGISRARRRHALRTGRWTHAAYGAIGVVDVRADDRFLVARRRHALAAAAAARSRPGHVDGALGIRPISSPRPLATPGSQAGSECR